MRERRAQITAQAGVLLRATRPLIALLLAASCGGGTEGTPAAPTTPPAPAPAPAPEPAPEPGPGLHIFNFPLRAIAISGNWGTNRDVVEAWEDAGGTGPL